MFIQTEETPNPAVLKFLPGRVVMERGTADFPSVESAVSSGLARKLFEIEGVKAVFLGADFVSVTKDGAMAWDLLKPPILGVLMDYLGSGQKIIEDGTGIASSLSDDDSEIVKEIKTLIDERIRPAVAQDGGDIVFDRFEEGVVYLEMRGACSGCPSSTATLKQGIENMLRYYIPEVEEVRPVAG